MIGYHVTTPSKLAQYRQTGAILPPVRFWPTYDTAQAWARKTGRSLILRMDCEVHYPLPDHRPAHWTPEIIRHFEEAQS